MISDKIQQIIDEIEFLILSPDNVPSSEIANTISDKMNDVAELVRGNWQEGHPYLLNFSRRKQGAFPIVTEILIQLEGTPERALDFLIRNPDVATVDAIRYAETTYRFNRRRPPLSAEQVKLLAAGLGQEITEANLPVVEAVTRLAKPYLAKYPELGQAALLHIDRVAEAIDRVSQSGEDLFYPEQISHQSMYENALKNAQDLPLFDRAVRDQVRKVGLRSDYAASYLAFQLSQVAVQHKLYHLASVFESLLHHNCIVNMAAYAYVSLMVDRLKKAQIASNRARSKHTAAAD